MLAYPIRKALPGLVVAASLAGFSPLAITAQVREVVSKQVSVGRASAELSLEFADGGRLEVALGDGTALIDGRSAGSYQPGSELDTAWRTLLGQAVALDDGPLAQALVDWTVPAELSGAAAELARNMDRALEDALRSAQVPAAASAQALGSSGDTGSLLGFLLGSGERLRYFQQALTGIGPAARVHGFEDVVIEADEVVASDLVVIQSDTRIAGTVNGNVAAIGGSLELLEGSSVSGSVRLADATLLTNDGSIGGRLIDVREDAGDLEDEIRVELRDEIRTELRRELRSEMRDQDRGFSLFAPFRPIVRGVGGVLENLVAIFVLALIGAAVIAFGGDKVDVIAETARRAPGRAAAVGMAATVLLIPVWVLGFIALLVSIIGIPVAIAWLPLFPLAAFMAGIVGYLAVARNTGEWLADSDYPWTHWIRKSNTLVTTIGGLVGLMLLFIAANVVSMAPFLGVVTGLLVAAGFVVTVLAVEIGLGAVILTRAGRRREQWSRYSADEAWEAAMSVDVDDVDIDDVAHGESGKAEQNDA